MSRRLPLPTKEGKLRIYYDAPIDAAIAATPLAVFQTVSLEDEVAGHLLACTCHDHGVQPTFNLRFCT